MSDALVQALMMGQRRRADPLERQRAYADALIKQGSETTPVRSPTEGLARALQGGLGGFMAAYTDHQRQEKSAKGVEALTAAINAKDPTSRAEALKNLDPDNEYTAPMLAQIATQQFSDERAQARLQQGSGQLGASYGVQPQGGTGNAGQAISGIESGGRYDAVGPVANQQGHRAFGKYQVLEPNIGPWTQEVLGKPMTPQEFIANPQAQDAVFQAKFGQYVQKHGSPEAASRAWFAGEGGMNNPGARDVNGMTVQNYGQKFTQAYGPGAGGAPTAAPATGAPAPLTINMTPGGQPPVPQGAADANGTPVQPGPPQFRDVPRPSAPPEVVARIQQDYQNGLFGRDDAALGKARAAIESERDKLWQIQREQSAKQYDQAYEDFRYGRKRSDEMQGKQFDQEGQLRDKFAAEPPVKSFRAVVPMLEAAKKAGPTRAGDLNLVYAFAKMMDPDSVVRESETAGVVATASVADRLQAYIGQLNGQPQLSPEVRGKLMKELETRYQALQTSHDELKNQYGQIATSYGLTPDRVTLGVRPAPAAAPPGAQPQQAPQQQGNPLAEAQEAIKRGAPRDAVMKRLQEMGVDPSGL